MPYNPAIAAEPATPIPVVTINAPGPHVCLMTGYLFEPPYIMRSPNYDAAPRCLHCGQTHIYSRRPDEADCTISWQLV